jgi:hypothetical protein
VGFFSATTKYSPSSRTVALRGGVEKKKQGFVAFYVSATRILWVKLDKGSIYDGAAFRGCKFLCYRVNTNPRYAGRLYDTKQNIINGTIQRNGIELLVDAVNDSNLKPFVDAVFNTESNKVMSADTTYADSTFFVGGRG